MKIFLLHIVFIIYTASVVRPVLPAVVDLLAHTFQELEHTSTVHAHRGEQHLHFEMQSLVTEQRDDAPAPKIEFSVTPHLLAKIEISFPAAASSTRAWRTLISVLPVTYLLKPFPPPKR